MPAPRVEAAPARAVQAARAAASAGPRFGPQTAPSTAGQGSLTAEAEEAVAQSHGGRGMARHDRAAPALPRPAGEGLGDHDPELAVRPQGDPGLHPRPRPAELAGLPATCSVAASGPGSWCRSWRSGFAVGVERVAAYDMGYDSACDEIDLLEVHGGYPRAHLSRFASLYSTGRGTVHDLLSRTTRPPWPCRSTTAGRSAARTSTTSVWQSYPVPALAGLPGPAAEPGHVPRRADGSA